MSKSVGKDDMSSACLTYIDESRTIIDKAMLSSWKKSSAKSGIGMIIKRTIATTATATKTSNPFTLSLP
jgi:hypothetical protein